MEEATATKRRRLFPLLPTRPRQGDRDLEKASIDFRLWAETYPADAVPHAALGDIYTDLGQEKRALAEREEVLNLDPRPGLHYGNLVKTLLMLGQFERAESLARLAENNGLDSPSKPRSPQ